MASKALEMQRKFSLRLYRAILTTHRSLPPEMRAIGDIYVREEFKLHKNAKPEHLQPFFDQWLQYLDQMKGISGMEFKDIGMNLPYEDIDALPEEKKEKLYHMHDETARLFSGNWNDADLGVGLENTEGQTVTEETTDSTSSKSH